MKNYEAIFKDDSEGVFAISLVEDPAMESLFIALNKQIQLKTINEDQQILMGLVLEPNKQILRSQDGEEFTITFSEDTIKELSHNFFKSGFQKNSSIEHEDKKEGVTFVESWIVEDTKIDKSAKFGFSFPKGSWVATMKVDSKEIWDDYVKTGKVQGFSVDAMIDLKEIKLNKYNMKNEIAEAIKNGFEAFFTLDKKVEKEIKLGSVQSGDIVIMYEGEVPEVGGAVWVESEDGERVALPVGDYPLEDGRILVVSEEGMVAEIKAEGEEELDTETSDTKQMEEITNAIKSIMIKYSEGFDKKLEDIKTELSELTKENKDLKKEVVTLSEQPAAKPLTVVAQVALNSKGRLLEKMRQNQN